MPLSASKRIFLLKEISDRLQMEEWPLIDLTHFKEKKRRS
jgi:hypothetical protein